jgi:ABC-type multidrug transport system ATPase subunit
MIASKLV